MVHMGKTGSDINSGMISHNDFHNTLLGGHEEIMIETNANNPPTIKAYSRFSIYATSSDYTIPNGTDTENLTYPQNTTPSYLNAQAIYEGADVTFTWNSVKRGATIPVISDGTWYVYCSGAYDLDATSKGQGVYNFSKTETPTYSHQKGGWYSASGYRVLASFVVASSAVSTLVIYQAFGSMIYKNTTKTLPAEADIIRLSDSENSYNEKGISVINFVNYNNSTSVKTADYTGLDGDGIGHVIFDFSAGNLKMLTYTLPTLADNYHRKIKISTYGHGIAKIDGEGAETILINGTAVDYTYLYCSGNYIEVIGTSLGWLVISKNIYMETGWLYNTDQTNVDFGLKALIYDGLTGTFAVGERITVNSVANAGIILADTGSILLVYECSSSQCGQFTNDWTIAGAYSSATADVNGTNTNFFGNFGHVWGMNGIDLDHIIYFNTSASYTNARKVADPWGSTSGGNFQTIQVDTNNLKFQSGAAGIFLISDTDGNINAYTGSSIYLNFRVNIR